MDMSGCGSISSRKRKSSISGLSDLATPKDILNFKASKNIFDDELESSGSHHSDDLMEASILETFNNIDTCENKNLYSPRIVHIQKPFGFLSGLRLSDAISFRHDKMIITTASPPFHIEWANAAWSRQCGWSSDEILGLDFKFLQGSATDLTVVRKFLNILESSGGFASMTILNYAKSHQPLRNVISTFPLLDNCAVSEIPVVTHIGIILNESDEVNDYSINELQRVDYLSGKLQDRRVNSRKYSLMGTLPPPIPTSWAKKAKSFSLSLMLRYMIRSQAAIVLTSLDGRVLHANGPWTCLSGFKVSEVEGVPFINFIDLRSNSNSIQCIHNVFSGSNIVDSSVMNSQLVIMLKCKGKSLDKQFLPQFNYQGFGSTHAPNCTYCNIHHENTEKLTTNNSSLKYNNLTIVKFQSDHIAILITPIV